MNKKETEQTTAPKRIHHHEDDTFSIESMPSEEEFDMASDTFQVLCDSTRLKILWLVSHSEECVTNIASIVGMSAPAVSHHLRHLRQSGIIVNKRVGKEMYYSLADTEKAQLLHKSVDAIFNISH